MGSGRMVAMAVCRITSSKVLTELTSITTFGVICSRAKYSSMRLRVTKSVVSNANSNRANSPADNAAWLSYRG
ncbi:hypothetical protein D3C87_1818390 [compost metagenome]